MLGKRGNVMFILLLSINDFLYIVKSLPFRSGLPGRPLNLSKLAWKVRRLVGVVASSS
jgi:hypothetical protein